MQHEWCSQKSSDRDRDNKILQGILKENEFNKMNRMCQDKQVEEFPQRKAQTIRKPQKKEFS
jgi:hypothetical protein